MNFGAVALQLRDIPFFLQGFTDRDEGGTTTFNCRCLSAWLMSYPSLFRGANGIKRAPAFIEPLMPHISF